MTVDRKDEPISPMRTAKPRQLSITELNFVLRSLGDIEHFLAVSHGLRITESDIGEHVDEDTSWVTDFREQLALLDLLQHLLGATDKTPEPLDRQFGIRAAIEASGDAEALRLYDHWRGLSDPPVQPKGPR
jgi:hypothetical protein